MKTAIEAWQEKECKFKPEPRYYKEGDFLTYFVSETRCIGRKKGTVTIYTNCNDGSFVGLKIDNFSKLSKEKIGTNRT